MRLMRDEALRILGWLCVAVLLCGMGMSSAGAATNSAAYLGADVATLGNWKGVYGADGYAVFGDSTSYPSYAQVSASGKADYVWAAQSADPRALQRGVAAGRIAGCWYGGAISIDLNLSDGNNHKVTLYLLDWDSSLRSTRVDVLDGDTQQVLASQNASSFHNGAYLKWDLRGHVIVRVTNTGGSNSVISGLFFDAPGAAPPAADASSAAFVGSDVTTQGNWKGVYGADGYAIIGDSTSYPTYAQVSASGKADYVWAAQSADPRAPQRGVQAGRIAGCWYGGVVNIDLNLTDGNSHKVTLYLLDWDSSIRSARVDVVDAGTQQVLATQNVSGYRNGVHLKWDLRGHVIVRVTNTGGSNTVVSGLFFDSSGGTPAAARLSVSGTVSAGGQSLNGVGFISTGALSCSATDSTGRYSCSVPQGARAPSRHRSVATTLRRLPAPTPISPPTRPHRTTPAPPPSRPRHPWGRRSCR